jgi:chitin disaccharide deacetylase
MIVDKGERSRVAACDPASTRKMPGVRCLIVTAEDYGYWPTYDEGILEVARRGAVDSVSAMVASERCDPKPLLETGVEVGLHLELPGWGGGPLSRGKRAGPGDRAWALALLERQLAMFEDLFGRSPAYLDGHHHCHAAPGLAGAIARAAGARGLPLRSIGANHRRTLRCFGVPAPDRLVGRLSPDQPALPDELWPVVSGEAVLPAGVTEWMTHPGYPDPASGSGYDAGREEDLELLLELGDREAWAARGTARRTHAEAFDEGASLRFA